MTQPNLILLYVEDTAASAAFYADLLDLAPAVASPNFTAFPLDSGVTLGLWARASVEPAPAADGARTEIAFMVPDRAAIEALLASWTARGLTIAQPLTIKDFGPTFTALDPDGHRLRVCLFDA